MSNLHNDLRTQDRLQHYNAYYYDGATSSNERSSSSKMIRITSRPISRNNNDIGSHLKSTANLIENHAMFEQVHGHSTTSRNSRMGYTSNTIDRINRVESKTSMGIRRPSPLTDGQYRRAIQFAEPNLNRFNQNKPGAIQKNQLLERHLNLICSME